MIVRAITIDFWGTLMLDLPGSDNRYKSRRLKDFETILAGAGVRASTAALERAYEASAVYLGRIWAAHRDVPVQDHVRAIVGAIDRDLPARLPADVLAALVNAYARPILMVPPTVDDGALDALRKLSDLGYTLAVVSNTMRTPGATLRRVLERYGLLSCFAHIAFSDELGVRKPDHFLERFGREESNTKVQRAHSPSFFYWLRPNGLAFAAAHVLTGCAPLLRLRAFALALRPGLHSQPLMP